uniref:J domain-containing protein n=1 Tax=Acrobeloides nanus TaxID=290746 RepID=A0A914CRW5_9BILA
MQTYYNLLNLSEDCQQEELKNAYFQLIRQIHPDKGENSDVLLFHQLQEVWKILRVPELRRKYDTWLREQRLRELKQLVEDCRCGVLKLFSVPESFKEPETNMNTSNKVLVLGDSGVGKSTFVNNLAGKYDQIPTSTIGCNVQVFMHQYAAGTPKECFEIVELWDVSGSNVHRKTAANVFFDGAQGVIFVYDLSNSRSEENLAQWTQLLYNCPRHLGPHPIGNRVSDVEHSGQLPTLVVGTRLDLAPHRVKPDPSASRLLQHTDCVYLDCRKEIPAGSTNRLLISRFFDSVVEKARDMENGNSAFTQQRRRRVI